MLHPEPRMALFFTDYSIGPAALARALEERGLRAGRTPKEPLH